MLVTVALDQQTCLLKLHRASVHVCSTSTTPAAVPHCHQTYLPLCMFDHVAQDQHTSETKQFSFCNSFTILAGLLQHSCFFSILLSNTRHVCYSCIRPPSTSVTIKILPHACLLELHIISRYQFLCPASTSVVVGLNQQIYMLHLSQTSTYGPMLVPNQRACKHNFT